MDKFMFLFRGSDVYQPGQSPEMLQTLKQKMVDWLVILSEKGMHIGSEPLESGGKLVNGKNRTIVDSPFGSLKEIVGGCTFVQATDLGEAVEIAKSCPILDTNATIEVRPVQKL
ncbi:YciI family protein [Chryseolinea sp. T2]|uniref:YciI family protein n=1 Tax=Chryseolinea sp. T2 TaxID=3129255 RepID=UPI0030786DA0